MKKEKGNKTMYREKIGRKKLKIKEKQLELGKWKEETNLRK